MSVLTATLYAEPWLRSRVQYEQPRSLVMLVHPHIAHCDQRNVHPRSSREPGTLKMLEMTVLATSRYLAPRKRTSPQLPLLRLRLRPDVEVENIHRQPDSRARVRYVDDTRYVALDGRTREEEIDLVVVVACGG
jgi:hypothetical protein